MVKEIDPVKFVEETFSLELLDFQKDFLTETYNRLKNGEDIVYYPPLSNGKCTLAFLENIAIILTTLERNGNIKSGGMFEFSKKFGERIFSLMYNNGIGISEFAEKMNYSCRDLFRIINGDLLLSPTDARKIADFFGISKKELLSFANEEIAERMF